MGPRGSVLFFPWLLFLTSRSKENEADDLDHMKGTNNDIFISGLHNTAYTTSGLVDGGLVLAMYDDKAGLDGVGNTSREVDQNRCREPTRGRPTGG
jgi:hypothetical protein